MLFGLLGAFVAAVCYGAATIVQAIGVRRLAGHSPRRDLPAWARAGWPYAAGLALDIAGFVASVAALRTLPLFLVEPAIASSVVVTALLSVWVLRMRLSGREWVAVAAVVVGLALLAVSAEPGPAREVAPAWAWITLAGAVAVAAMAVVGVRIRGRPSAVLLAVASGVGFSGVGIAARLIEPRHPLWHSLGDPMFWALVAHGVLAVVCYGYALARGRVTTVAAITFSVETVVPAVIGLVWLGDSMRDHAEPLALVGFLVTVGACVVLAGRAT